MNGQRIKTLFLLHLLLAVYSTNGIFSKLAAGQPFLSPRFCLYYSVIVILLGGYALAWQQIIKRMPLTIAFSNKAVTVVWGMVWGAIWFQEQITLGKVLGGALVVLGVVIFAWADKADQNG